MRSDPQGTIARCHTCGKHSQDESDILARQRAQVHIDRIEQAFISLKPRTCEGLDLTTQLIIETEGNITVRGAVLAIDRRAEAVTILDSEGGEETLYIPVLNVLREGDDSGPCIGGA